MVKIINGLADKLADARKEIERLTREKAALSHEVQLLRASSTRSSSTISLRKEPSTYSSDDRETCHPQTKYDRPTQASTNRAAETRESKQRNEKTKRTEIRLDCATYIYVDGRPIKIDDQYHHVPRYMQETRSSTAKMGDKALNKAWESSACEWGETSFASMDDGGHGDKEGEITPPEDIGEAVATSTESGLYSWADLCLLLGKPRAELIPDLPVRIPSTTGYDMLNTGRRIAQEAFYDAARKFVSYIMSFVMFKIPRVSSLKK